MRHRRWVLLLALVLVVFVPLVRVGLTLASRHPAFRRAAAERILPSASGRVAIGEMEVGLTSLRFSDVRVDLPDGGLVEVPSATVGLSLRRLVATGFRLSRSVGSLVVVGPRVVVVVAPSDGDTLSRPPSLAPIFESLPDRLSISDASISIVDRGGAWAYGVSSVDLVAERRSDGRLGGDASGTLLSGARNARAGFEWDGAARTLSVALDVAGADVSLGSPIPPGGSARVTAGVLDGRLAMTVRDGAPATYSLEFGARGASVFLPGAGETVEAVSGRGTIEDGRLTLDGASGRWRDARVEASGAVSFADRVFYSAVLAASAVPLHRLAELASPDSLDIEGTADLRVVIDGPFGQPVFDVAFEDASLRAAGVAADRLSGAARVAPGAVEVSGVEGDVAGGRLAAHGRAERGPDADEWRIELEGDVAGVELAEIARNRAAGRVSLVGFRLSGTPEAPHFETTVYWDSLTLGRVSLAPGAGGVLLDGGDVALMLRALDGTYAIEGTAGSLFSRPVLDLEVEVEGLRADSTFGLPRAPLVPDVLDGLVGIVGPWDALSVAGSLVMHGRDLEATCSVSGRVAAGVRGRVLTATCRADSARIRGLRLPVLTDVVVDGEGVAVPRLEVGEVLEARLSVGADGGLSGSAVVSDAKLPDVLQAATGSPPPASVGGTVSASLEVGGTVEAPEAGFEARLSGGSAFGVEGLSAGTRARLRGRTITLDRLEVSVDDSVFLTASGSADLDGEVTVSVRGDDVPGALLLGDADTRFALDVGVGGPARRPTFDARVESGGGRFLRVPFDRLVARVTEAEGVVRVDPLALEREGSYRLTASGRIPLSALARDNSGEGTVTAEVSGDPFALLAEATPLVTEASGDGTVRLNLAVNREGVEIATCEVDARASSVRPSALFGELTDVRLSASVVDGLLISGELEGLADGRAVRLRALPAAEGVARGLEPLSAYGIDLGVLALSTDPRGVRVSVPGLMQSGDVGRVAARGRDGEPEFLIAGPREHAALLGELELSDMTFTYPFHEGGGGFGGTFLSSADWSVRMTAGRNLWYARSDAALNVERGGCLDFVGTPGDHTLCVAGRLDARRGTVDYGGADFDVQAASVLFPAFCEPPRFYIEAATRVEDGTTITLTMDSAEGDLTLAAPGATLDESTLALRSDAPEDDTPEKVLSKLKYGVSYELLAGEEQASLERKRAIDVVGSQVGGWIVRPLLSPIEARLRRNLRLDLARIEVDFVGHFLSQLDEWRAQEGRAQYAPFLADTRITLGKYLARDWLLSYVGRAETFEEDIGYQRLDLRHEIGVEYEVSRHTSLSLRAVYDPAASSWDRWISVENRFRF